MVVVVVVAVVVIRSMAWLASKKKLRLLRLPELSSVDPAKGATFEVLRDDRRRVKTSNEESAIDDA